MCPSGPNAANLVTPCALQAKPGKLGHNVVTNTIFAQRKAPSKAEERQTRPQLGHSRDLAGIIVPIPTPSSQLGHTLCDPGTRKQTWPQRSHDQLFAQIKSALHARRKTNSATAWSRPNFRWPTWPALAHDQGLALTSVPFRPHEGTLDHNFVTTKGSNRPTCSRLGHDQLLAAIHVLVCVLCCGSCARACVCVCACACVRACVPTTTTFAPPEHTQTLCTLSFCL